VGYEFLVGVRAERQQTAKPINEGCGCAIKCARGKELWIGKAVG
jgi:hypothetical protein